MPNRFKSWEAAVQELKEINSRYMLRREKKTPWLQIIDKQTKKQFSLKRLMIDHVFRFIKGYEPRGTDINMKSLVGHQLYDAFKDGHLSTSSNGRHRSKRSVQQVDEVAQFNHSLNRNDAKIVYEHISGGKC